MHLPSRASFANDAVSVSENCINAYKPEKQIETYKTYWGKEKEIMLLFLEISANM
jgi:hypothetical protein